MLCHAWQRHPNINSTLSIMWHSGNTTPCLQKGFNYENNLQLHLETIPLSGFSNRSITSHTFAVFARWSRQLFWKSVNYIPQIEVSYALNTVQYSAFLLKSSAPVSDMVKVLQYWNNFLMRGNVKYMANTLSQPTCGFARNQCIIWLILSPCHVTSDLLSAEFYAKMTKKPHQRPINTQQIWSGHIWVFVRRLVLNKLVEIFWDFLGNCQKTISDKSLIKSISFAIPVADQYSINPKLINSLKNAVQKSGVGRGVKEVSISFIFITPTNLVGQHLVQIILDPTKLYCVINLKKYKTFG